MTRALITGAGGFLGRALCSHLRELGWDIIPVDNAVIPTGDQTDCIKVDAVDYSGCLELAVKAGHCGNPITHVVCAAGIASPYWYSRKPLETIDVAVAGTRNMLELARHTGARLLYLSSSEVYGDPDIVPTPETYLGRIDTMGKRAPYDESKRLGETLCSAYVAKHGVQAVIARPFNVYGPGMSDQDHRMMAELRNAVRGQRPVHLYGSGQHTRTFCYIDDAVEGLRFLLEYGQAGLAYNVGTDSPEVSMLELCARAGVDAVTEPYPDGYPAAEPTRRCPDLKRIRGLGYSPRVSLEDGLRRFLT